MPTPINSNIQATTVFYFYFNELTMTKEILTRLTAANDTIFNHDLCQMT